MKIVVLNHVSLDGVMQAPGRPDEDPRDGFERGGWAVANNDDVMNNALGARMARRDNSLLFGRRTYEDLLAHWNSVTDSPFTAALNNTPKFVASRTRSEPLPWPNSTLLRGNVQDAVAELKSRPGGDLNIMGSGELIRALLPARLIDEFLLMIHPTVLGAGRRLFAGTRDTSVALDLVEATTTTKGVILATYRPAASTDPDA